MLILALLASACGDSAGTSAGASQANSPTPWAVTAFPALPEIVNDVPEARIELGRLLFFDPVLSVDRQTACVTCHSEIWGMGDGIPRAIGHGAGLDAGPGREGPNVLRRNSPALYNLAFRSSLFWDGRAATLEEQVLVPLFGEQEMGSDRETLLADLSSIPEYARRFQDAFPDDPRVTLENLASALAAYERTFISNRSTYDAYLKGRPELMNEEQVAGMYRFAEMGCDGCHAPPLFESETFANRNVPEVEGIIDFGLEEQTGRPEDRGKFRAPSLRNLRSTEPYFHNGSVKVVTDAIRHELEQSGMPFTDDDVRLITLFIDKTLRDETREAIRPVSVPSGLPLSIDPAGP
ncbi:MAG: cytochrome c peroxidase [Polyangiales bacterium]